MRLRATGSEPMLYTSSSTPASGLKSIGCATKVDAFQRIEHMFVI